MFMPSVLDAPASTNSSISTSADTQTDAPPPPTEEQAPVRHLVLGTPRAVKTTIRVLYQKGYAEPNDWSEPLPTSRPNEVMAILTKRIKLME